jgi:hypothetical protein
MSGADDRGGWISKRKPSSNAGSRQPANCRSTRKEWPMKPTSNTRRLVVDVHQDTGLDVPDVGHVYIHCSKCLDEWTESFQDIVSPKGYARQQVSFAKDGRIQVWCTRCERNITLISLRAVENKPNADRGRS